MSNHIKSGASLRAHNNLRFFLAAAFISALFLSLVLSFIATQTNLAYGIALLSLSGIFGKFGLATLHKDVISPVKTNDQRRQP